jgi:hypothetical protein
MLSRLVDPTREELRKVWDERSGGGTAKPRYESHPNVVCIWPVFMVILPFSGGIPTVQVVIRKV